MNTLVHGMMGLVSYFRCRGCRATITSAVCEVPLPDIDDAVAPFQLASEDDAEMPACPPRMAPGTFAAAEPSESQIGGFVLALPIFCVIIEFLGLIARNPASAMRYDRLARDFLKVSLLALSLTAVVGSLMLGLFITLYPSFMSYMGGTFKTMMPVYALVFLGESLFLTGRRDDARLAFGRVLRFDPDHVCALYFDGVLLAEASPGLPAKVTTLPLTSGRPLTTLSGTLEEVLARAEEVQGAYVRVELTEKARVGLADEVRSAIPDAVEVTLVSPEAAAGEEPEQRQSLDPDEAFRRYLTERGQDDHRVEELFSQLLDEALTAGFEQGDEVLAQVAAWFDGGGDRLVGERDRAHLGHEVVGGDLRARDQDPVLTLERRFPAAVQEVRAAVVVTEEVGSIPAMRRAGRVGRRVLDGAQIVRHLVHQHRIHEKHEGGQHWR